MSSTKLHQLRNRYRLRIMDRKGALLPVDSARVVRNVALPVLWPGERVHICDWSGGPVNDVVLTTPITYLGKEYYGHLGWGSAVKAGQTLLMQHDFLAECGLLREAERAQKTSRMLIQEGQYGALQGKMRLMVVRRGTVIDGNPVDDGHSLIRREVAELGREEDQDPIELGAGRQSYTFWQRIPWSDELEAELLPVIRETLAKSNRKEAWKFSSEGPAMELKEELCAIDPVMVKHPFVARAYSRNAADMFARMATTVDIPTTVRVAVPTLAPRAALVGAHALTRYPVDSNGSTQVRRIKETPLIRAEMERIAKLEVIQYTISSKKLMANGCFGIVDELPEGVDAVLCLDDIKMRVEALDGLKHGDVIEIEGVITFNQWFAAGSAIGINGKWAGVRMGADFDGDMIFDILLEDYPVLFRTIACRPRGESEKPPKTHSTLAARPTMIVNSMANLVGFASNVASTTFVFKNRELLAKQLGYGGEAALNQDLNKLIKFATDLYKSIFNLPELRARLSTLQGNLQPLTSGTAPWCDWPNDWAFTRDVPEFYREGLSEEAEANCVPKHFDGTVAQICKHTLDQLRIVLLDGPIEMVPLSAFVDWVPQVDKELARSAHDLQLDFNAKVAPVSFTVTKSGAFVAEVQKFKAWWSKTAEAWVKMLNVPRKVAVYALWREAHSPRSENATGASVFMAFPDECKAIIRDKPGHNAAAVEDVSETVLVGLNYVFDVTPEHLRIPVEIREFRQIKGNATLVRKIVMASVVGQKDPIEPYPKGMLGMVEVHSPQPECGTYRAEIVKAGYGKAWHCKLSR